MISGRCLALGVCAVAVLAGSASAQTGGKPAAIPDVVVNGAADAQSAWRRAESAHVIVTGKSSDAELKRVTNNLERLYAVMSRVFRRGDAPDETAKLQVTLIDTTAEFRAMNLHNVRSEEGPYPAVFAGQRYYDPREDGDVLVVARSDQTIKLATALAEDKDTADAAGGDGESANGLSSLMTSANRRPLSRSWEDLLYSAFAQHFILTYLPAAYPRWYLDGVGALFSTMQVRTDGKIDYAEAPEDYQQVLRSYGELRVGDILSGSYLTAPPGTAHWTPYHAWLLTHFFLFSKLKPERSRQFAQYMNAIRQGTPMAEAAKVFGNMDRLRDEIRGYGEKGLDYARADAVAAPGGDPLINPLTRGSAALIEARLEMDGRLADPQHRADWLAQLHATVAGLPYNPDAILTEAEADCRGGDYAACLAAADSVLAKTPDTVAALAWKGVAQTHLALAGPVAARAAGLATARETITRALRLDNDAPLPLIAYYQSFAEAGEAVPDAAMLGLANVTRHVPAAPAPRLYLARELVRRGQADLARRVLYPVLYGAYDSPEKTAAAALFAGGAPAAAQ